MNIGYAMKLRALRGLDTRAQNTAVFIWFPRRSRPLGFNIRGIYTIVNLLSNKTVCVSHLEDRQLLRMRSRKVVAACIFNELQAAGLFLALDGTSTCINPSTSGRYRSDTDHQILVMLLYRKYYWQVYEVYNKG